MSGQTFTGGTIKQQAFRWLVRLHSGECSKAERQAFRAWLNEHDSHRQAYAEAQAFWHGLEQFQSSPFPELEEAERFRPPPLAHPPPWAARIGVGLALAFVVGIFAYLGLFQTTTEVYRTAKGGHATVTLAEGSTIELDADTEVNVSLGWRSRTVRLMRGEALFTVTHDPDRPFEVKAGGGRIRDLGTVFDVSRDRDEVSVAVIEGEVGVILGAAGTPYHLDAGQRLSYHDTGAVVSFGGANLEAVTAWRTGKLIFEDLPLERVLAQISRYHDVDFTVSDPELAELKVSGTFEARNLPVLLATIEATLPVTSERVGERRIVIERTRR